MLTVIELKQNFTKPRERGLLRTHSELLEVLGGRAEVSGHQGLT